MADVAKRDVARGAGVVALSRLGALVELITTPIYTWLFGVPTFGLYAVLWSVVNLVSNCIDLGFTAALQRVVPQASDETRAHAALKLALLVGVIPSVAVAVIASAAAGPLSNLVNAAPQDRAELALAVAIFAWALPLWTFSEIATAAVRARRAFGPEVRLRVFWEPVIRLAVAVLAFALGMRTLGLFVAHLASLVVVCLLAARLIGRYYDFGLLRRAPLDRAVLRELVGYGLTLLPGGIVRRVLLDLPPVLLNLLIAGAGGATAAGLYVIARKISSVPLLIRQTFFYVLAPLASAQALRDRAAIQPLYAFAVRLSTALAGPLALVLVLLGDGILQLFGPGAQAALPLVLVLVAARAVEAAIGPAGPILEVVGHRKWLLFNALAGLVVWLVLMFLLVPRLAGFGMAIAVALGTLASSMLAVVQLSLVDRLHALSARLALSLVALAIAAAAMWGAETATRPFGEVVQSVTVLLLLVPALWLSLRLGLTPTDRAALGPVARWLGANRSSA